MAEPKNLTTSFDEDMRVFRIRCGDLFGRLWLYSMNPLAPYPYEFSSFKNEDAHPATAPGDHPAAF